MADQSASSSAQSGSPSDRRNLSQYVGFEIGDQHFAFRIEQIREIVARGQVTPAPLVADYVEGVSNLRGAIIPIINLRKLFGLEPKPIDADMRIIVVTVGDRTMGCTVDAVSQVMRIPEDHIQPAPDTVTAGGADYISGFAKQGERLVILLDINKMLDPERLECRR